MREVDFGEDYDIVASDGISYGQLSSVEIAVGASEMVDDLVVETHDPDPLKKARPGHTALHEMDHFAGFRWGDHIGVNLVTIEPTSEYNGATFPKKYGPIGASAAHGMGRRGTGFDVWQMRLRGDNPDRHGATAAGIINAHEKEHRLLASVLQASKRLTGNAIENILDRVNNGREVWVKVKSRFGVHQFATKVREGENAVISLSRYRRLRQKPKEKIQGQKDEKKPIDLNLERVKTPFSPVGEIFFNKNAETEVSEGRGQIPYIGDYQKKGSSRFAADEAGKERFFRWLHTDEKLAA